MTAVAALLFFMLNRALFKRHQVNDSFTDVFVILLTYYVLTITFFLHSVMVCMNYRSNFCSVQSVVFTCKKNQTNWEVGANDVVESASTFKLMAT